MSKRHAPATQRNRDAIVQVLSGHLPRIGLALEIASGTGEHVTYFARSFPMLRWQPSDLDEAGLESIRAWAAESVVPNIFPPVRLDASAPQWPVDHADAILCINMIHISPWMATEGLMAGAGRCLVPGGLLYLYGPFLEDEVPLAPSNAAFDASLKSRDPHWGLRPVEDVVTQAASHGLRFDERVEMPANNLSLIFRKEAG